MRDLEGEVIELRRKVESLTQRLTLVEGFAFTAASTDASPTPEEQQQSAAEAELDDIDAAEHLADLLVEAIRTVRGMLSS